MSSIKRYVRKSLRYRKTPAVIGTGWLEHYAVAHKFRWRQVSWPGRILPLIEFQYHVSTGWGYARWETPSIWYAGEIKPL